MKFYIVNQGDKLSVMAESTRTGNTWLLREFPADSLADYDAATSYMRSMTIDRARQIIKSTGGMI